MLLINLIPWKLFLYNRLLSSFAHIFLWGQSGPGGPRRVTSFPLALALQACLPFWCFSDTLPVQWFVFRKLDSDYFCFCFVNFLPHFLFLWSNYRKWGSSWLLLLSIDFRWAKTRPYSLSHLKHFPSLSFHYRLPVGIVGTPLGWYDDISSSAVGAGTGAAQLEGRAFVE